MSGVFSCVGGARLAAVGMPAALDCYVPFFSALGLRATIFYLEPRHFMSLPPEPTPSQVCPVSDVPRVSFFVNYGSWSDADGQLLSFLSCFSLVATASGVPRSEVAMPLCRFLRSLNALKECL